MSKLSELANGMSAAKHLASLGALVVAGAVSLTLLYAQVDDAAEAAEDNKVKIEAIATSFSELAKQQGIIIERIEGEKERSKEFRTRTDRSLRQILQRLVPREPSIRR